MPHGALYDAQHIPKTVATPASHPSANTETARRIPSKPAPMRPGSTQTSTMIEPVVWHAGQPRPPPIRVPSSQSQHETVNQSYQAAPETHHALVLHAAVSHQDIGQPCPTSANEVTLQQPKVPFKASPHDSKPAAMPMIEDLCRDPSTSAQPSDECVVRRKMTGRRKKIDLNGVESACGESNTTASSCRGETIPDPGVPCDIVALLADDRQLARVVSNERDSTATSSRGGFAPSNSRGGIAPANCRGGIAPANSRDGIAPANCRGGIAPANSRGGIAPANGRGGLAPANCRGGVAPANYRGGRETANSRGCMALTDSRGGTATANSRGGTAPVSSRGCSTGSRRDDPRAVTSGDSRVSRFADAEAYNNRPDPRAVTSDSRAVSRFADAQAYNNRPAWRAVTSGDSRAVSSRANAQADYSRSDPRATRSSDSRAITSTASAQADNRQHSSPSVKTGNTLDGSRADAAPANGSNRGGWSDVGNRGGLASTSRIETQERNSYGGTQSGTRSATAPTVSSRHSLTPANGLGSIPEVISKADLCRNTVVNSELVPRSDDLGKSLPSSSPVVSGATASSAGYDTGNDAFAPRASDAALPGDVSAGAAVASGDTAAGACRSEAHAQYSGSAMAQNIAGNSVRGNSGVGSGNGGFETPAMNTSNASPCPGGVGPAPAGSGDNPAAIANGYDPTVHANSGIAANSGRRVVRAVDGAGTATVDLRDNQGKPMRIHGRYVVTTAYGGPDDDPDYSCGETYLHLELDQRVIFLCSDGQWAYGCRWENGEEGWFPPSYVTRDF